jgi:hypothetical protein
LAGSGAEKILAAALRTLPQGAFSGDAGLPVLRPRRPANYRGQRPRYLVFVHHPFSAALAAEVPYAIGTVELAEGCRTVARLEQHTNLQPGQPFEVYYVQHNDWTEARFRRVPA